MAQMEKEIQQTQTNRMLLGSTCMQKSEQQPSSRMPKCGWLDKFKDILMPFTSWFSFSTSPFPLARFFRAQFLLSIPFLFHFISFLVHIKWTACMYRSIVLCCIVLCVCVCARVSWRTKSWFMWNATIPMAFWCVRHSINFVGYDERKGNIYVYVRIVRVSEEVWFWDPTFLSSSVSLLMMWQWTMNIEFNTKYFGKLIRGSNKTFYYFMCACTNVQ